MSRLALLAVLLLAFAPAVSRMAASGATQVVAGWSELCTSMGLKTLPSDARSLADMPAPAMPASGDYCDYCPLAASLSLLFLFLAFLLPAPPRAASLARAVPRVRIPVNFRGLGSQGPPVLL